MLGSSEFPDSRPAWVKVVATFPILALLIYFLIDTGARRSKEDDGSAYLDLSEMLFAFMLVAQISSIITVNVTSVFPLKHELLKRFVDEGQTILGDVYFDENYKCVKPYGEVTYAHPSPQYEKTYIRREANIFEKYSREWVTLLMLPNLPFSAQPRADLEIAYVASERKCHKMRFLGYYLLLFSCFCLFSPIFIVYVMNLDHDKAELGGYGWFYYGILAIFNPLIAIAINYMIYTEHFNWMMRGRARLLQEGEARIEEAAALPVAHTDLSGYRYLPMTNTKSQGSATNSSSFQDSGSKNKERKSKKNLRKGDCQSSF